MAMRTTDIFCPVCHHEGSQFNNGYIEDGEKIECGYCKSQYNVKIVPAYKITRNMRKNALKVKKDEE